MLKNGFVKKNVGTLTLGERLNKMRSEKRITLNEVSRSTKIQMKYLEFLEAGTYDKLPVDVYVRGFLRSYAQYLGADENYLIKLYDREREIHNNIKREEPKKNLFKPIKFSSLVFTPKVLIIALSVFFIGLGFFYLYRELSIFISNPRLVIISPVDNFSSSENLIKVEGVTEKDVKLSINEQTTVVNEEGKFSEVLVLQQGLNKITVKAVNRFDKVSEKVVTGQAIFQGLIMEENNSSQDQNPESDKSQGEENNMKVKADIYGDTKAVFIIVKADDEVVFSGEIKPGETKSFEAQNKISVSADKGKYAGVKINSKDMGLLGKDTKPIKDRIFTAE